MRAVLHEGRSGVWSRAVCHDPDSGPPIPPIAGASVSHDDLVLEAATGRGSPRSQPAPMRRLGAASSFFPTSAACTTSRGARPAARRAGRRGRRDRLLRPHGPGREARRGLPVCEHVPLTTGAGIQADVGAAVSHLRSQGVPAVFTVGFCFGGRRSWLSAAVLFGEQTLTYRELNARANQLAGRLQKLNVKPNQLVGVCMERSPAVIVAMVRHRQGRRGRRVARSRVPARAAGVHARRHAGPGPAHQVACGHGRGVRRRIAEARRRGRDGDPSRWTPSGTRWPRRKATSASCPALLPITLAHASYTSRPHRPAEGRVRPCIAASYGW